MSSLYQQIADSLASTLLDAGINIPVRVGKQVTITHLGAIGVILVPTGSTFTPDSRTIVYQGKSLTQVFTREVSIDVHIYMHKVDPVVSPAESSESATLDELEVLINNVVIGLRYCCRAEPSSVSFAEDDGSLTKGMNLAVLSVTVQAPVFSEMIPMTTITNAVTGVILRLPSEDITESS